MTFNFLAVLVNERVLSNSEVFCRLENFFVHSDVHSGFGGLEVACWPLLPKFAGSNPAEAVGFLRINKNPQHVGGHGCLL